MPSPGANRISRDGENDVNDPEADSDGLGRTAIGCKFVRHTR